MSKFSKAEIKELNRQKRCDLDDNGFTIYDYISIRYTPENKKKFIHKTINDNLQSNRHIMNKFMYELLMSNEVLNDTIKLYKDKLPSTKVAESSIHGLGVFALQDINPGSIVTFYPVHYIMDQSSNPSAVYMSDQILSRDLKMTTFTITDYVLTGVEEEHFLIGGHPEIYLDYQNGHMINHSSKANTYFQVVNGNQDHGCNIWIIIATKKIKTGTEITVNYGPRFAKVLG